MDRTELKARLAQAIYNYAVERTNANWENKRRVSLPKISCAVKSCGAFREWAIHLVRGKLHVSIDGFKVRAGHCFCSVGVLVGDGQFLFPHDDSRTSHNLQMMCTGGKIVDVTFSDVQWDADALEICEELEAATETIKSLVKEWDEMQRQNREASRKSDLELARKALSQ